MGNLVPVTLPMLSEKELTLSQITLSGGHNLIQDQSHACPSMSRKPRPLKNCTVENAESLNIKGGGKVVIRTTPLGADNPDSYSAVLVLDFGREVTGYAYRAGWSGWGIVDMGVSENLTTGALPHTQRAALQPLRHEGRTATLEAFEWDGFRFSS